MSPSDVASQKSPPWLAGFLFFSGLVSLVISGWLGRIDLAHWVEQRIVRARGTVSAETSAWLQHTPFAVWFLAGGVALLAAGAVALLIRPALNRLAGKVAAETSPRTFLQSWGVPLVSCLAVFGFYFPTLRSGYFRYDDFDLLATAQSGGWWETLWLPNGDHFLPLTRLLASLGLHGFGVTAWPYNLWVLLCLCGVLLAGIRLLEEFGVSRPAQLLFAALVIFWSPWAEIMTGYYILSTYLLITLLGLTAIWLYRRWLAQARTWQAGGMAACLLVAVLVDISGCLVIGACGVFLATDLAGGWPTTGWRPWLRRHTFLLGALAVASGIGLGCMAYAYTMLHPGIFLGMAGEGKRSLLQLSGDLGYVFGAGVLVAMVTPFVYARLPVELLGGLIAIVAVFWLLFTAFAVRAADRTRRWTLAAILLVVLGACLMVCLGRHNPDTMIVRWAAKHVCPAYVWFCVFLAAGWDTLWRNLRAEKRPLLAEATAIALAIFVVVQCGFGLLGMAVAFPPFGYPAEIRDAGRRRAAVEALRRDLIGRVADATHGAATIPTLDGNAINALYPSLFTYNLSRYRPFFAAAGDRVRLVRNAAMQPWPDDGVATVPVLRDAVSPEFLRLLAEDGPLRKLYGAETILEARVRREAPADNDRGFTIESEGVKEVVIHAAAWDPESAPRLRLAIRPNENEPAGDLPVAVVFWSERWHADWRGTLVLRPAAEEVTEVDLRQVYAFALSDRVSNLRLVLTKPGTYRFRLAEIAP